MKAPRGVLKQGEEGKVLRLKKGLYGLKQAGRGWYQEMSRVFISELGFTRSGIDHSVFFRRKGDSHIIVAVATDDMAVTSKHAVDAIKWFLGFEIKRDRNAELNQFRRQWNQDRNSRLTNPHRP
jgi:hypothetical protein